MKMPFEMVHGAEAQALGRALHDAVQDVTCNGLIPMVCGVDSDMQPTANVNDARFLVLQFPLPSGATAIGVVKINAGGMMTQVGSP